VLTLKYKLLSVQIDTTRFAGALQHDCRAVYYGSSLDYKDRVNVMASIDEVVGRLKSLMQSRFEREFAEIDAIIEGLDALIGEVRIQPPQSSIGGGDNGGNNDLGRLANNDNKIH
jgi:hypothetical protein